MARLTNKQARKKQFFKHGVFEMTMFDPVKFMAFVAGTSFIASALLLGGIA
jgi:hypothetical protein